jgi:hypothetical protein
MGFPLHMAEFLRRAGEASPGRGMRGKWGRSDSASGAAARGSVLVLARGLPEGPFALSEPVWLDEPLRGVNDAFFQGFLDRLGPCVDP